MIGGPTTEDLDWQNTPNSFNNTLVKVDGVWVMCPHNSGQIAFDLFHFESQYHLGDNFGRRLRRTAWAFGLIHDPDQS